MVKKSVCLGVVGIGLAWPLASHANVINFHDANQGYAYYSGYNVLMYGQGAAPDPGNNVWNGFGNYQGPNTVGVFYGGNNPNSNHGSVPANNPGNPYAWYSGTTTSGSSVFQPTSPGVAGNVNSDGTLSPVTLSLSYGGDNGINAIGSQPSVVQGTPAWILSEAALTPNSTTLGTFMLNNVPAGTYDLYLYGANYDGTRGAAFTVSSGTPLGGISETINPGGGPLQSFVLGQDYVEFLGVTPDSSGVISGTWGAVSNPISGLSGEGDFNGLQLVSVAAVPEPASIGALGLAACTLLRRRRRTV